MDLTPFTYKDLGEIVPSINARARRFIFKATDKGLRVTVPPNSRGGDLIGALDRLYDKLRALEQRYRESQKAQRRRLDWDFRINTPLLSLSFSKGSHDRILISRRIPVIFADGRIASPGEVRIICPELTDFQSDAVQELLTRGIEDMLQKQVRDYLVRRTLDRADRLGIKILGCRISKANHRWGSCSARKIINLSVFVSLLPDELQDFIITHELMHTLEMNHSARFHKLVDDALQGNEKRLDGMLKAYHPDILSFATK